MSVTLTIRYVSNQQAPLLHRESSHAAGILGITVFSFIRRATGQGGRQASNRRTILGKNLISIPDVFPNQSGRRGNHPERKFAEIGRDNGSAKVIARLHKTEAFDGEVSGECALQTWVMIPAHALIGFEDEYRRAETGGHDNATLHHPVTQVTSYPGQ